MANVEVVVPVAHTCILIQQLASHNAISALSHVSYVCHLINAHNVWVATHWILLARNANQTVIGSQDIITIWSPISVNNVIQNAYNVLVHQHHALSAAKDTIWWVRNVWYNVHRAHSHHLIHGSVCHVHHIVRTANHRITVNNANHIISYCRAAVGQYAHLPTMHQIVNACHVYLHVDSAWVVQYTIV